MDLRHLRYFVAVANERNFTRAAERLNVAQPPLSRQIRQLEEELGSALIDREARPIRLTEAGRLFYEHAVNVLAGADRLRTMMQGLGGIGRRRFVIGFVGSTLYGTLPEVIRRFRKASEGIDVGFVEASTAGQIAALKDGRIDAGFGRLRIEDPSVRRIVLADEPLVLVVPVGHPLADTRSPVPLDALIEQTLIVYPRPARPSYADQVLGMFRDRGLDPGSLMEVGELQTAIGLVAAHVGICLVPASVQRLRRDDVRYVPLADSEARSPIMLVHRAADASDDLARLIAIACDLHGISQPR